MNKLLTVAALLALLAACDDDQPLAFDGDTTTDEVDDETDDDDDETDDELNPDDLEDVNGVFGPVAGDVDAGEYDSENETLTVQITLDGDTLNQEYTRDDDRGIDGTGTYIAFSQQDDPLDRAFTAVGGESADGNSNAVVAADGGQFNIFFGGVTYNASNYTAPTTGLASYAGEYAGLSNISTRDDVLAVPVGTPDILLPTRSTVVTGDIFLNADFTDNAINGAIYNRVNDDGTENVIGGMFLEPGDIDSDGTFVGAIAAPVEDEDGEVTITDIGSYSGAIGGTNGSSLAGGIQIADFIPVVENEREYGIFVLNQCGTAGSADICSDIPVDDVDE